MPEAFEAVLFDLYGTLVNERGEAAGGAAVLLAALPIQRWAVVTSCGRQFAFELLAHACLPAPSILVGADDVQRMKPAPAGYLAAAKALGVAPAACLVVEDGASGVAAGKAAGMTVIAIARGGGSQSKSADRVIDTLASLHLEVKEEGTIALRSSDSAADS